MPKFRVYEIVPVQQYFHKIVEAESAEAALKLAQESYSEIEAVEYDDGTNNIVADVTYEVEEVNE